MAKCVNHPQVEAVATCSKCGKPFCEKCLMPEEKGEARLCRDCALRAAVEVSVREEEAKETARRERDLEEAKREEERFKRRQIFCLVGSLICLFIILFQFSSVSPIGIPTLRQRPVRIGTTETDKMADRCIENLWKISQMLQRGEKIDRNLVCPASGKPYIVEKTPDGDVVVHCPTPEKHGVSDLRVSKMSPIPEVEQ